MTETQMNTSNPLKGKRRAGTVGYPLPDVDVKITDPDTGHCVPTGETIGELQDRSLDVFSFDWRGQGLSDRMLPEREKGFVHHYGEYLEDLTLMLEAVVLPRMRGRLYLLAHSMGGHIGMRYLYREKCPVEFERAVFCAPMFNIKTDPFPSSFARWLSRKQVAWGNAHENVVGAARRTPFPERFEGNMWTSDRRRFERNRIRIIEHPELSAAMVTYGWVAATYESIEVLKQEARRKTPPTPLLIATAEKERVVSNGAIRKLVADADNCRLIEIKDSRHEILQEADRQRGYFWKAFDNFMVL
jgi:lysophospholipase